MIIRDMRLEDIEAVYQIECDSFSMPWSKESLIGELNSLIACYKVAVIDLEVVAYAGIRMVLGEGEITNIAVAKEYRGRGVGKALLDVLIKEAQQKEVNSITLEVREGNEIAKALYAVYGFKTIAVRKGYYQRPTEDALIMQWYKV